MSSTRFRPIVHQSRFRVRLLFAIVSVDRDLPVCESGD